MLGIKPFGLIKKDIRNIRIKSLIIPYFRSKGSILIEAVIMIGLISALTPVLYTHISDRKEEIDNINKANTLLMLQREAESFLKDKDKRDSLDFSSGGVVLSPSELSSNLSTALDSRYKIGFRQNAGGERDSISAVVVETEGSGSDIKASKVASLIGVSAGIKSAMDTENAYGVNGLWKENLSSYGIDGVPSGSTVVTTEYNKERSVFYTSDMFVDSDVDFSGHKLTADRLVTTQVCIGGEDEEHCRDSWEGDVDADLILLKTCYDNIEFGIPNSDYCIRALDKGITEDCSSISDTYIKVNLQAPSGYYYLGPDYTKKVCYFIDGKIPSSAKQVIDGCNDSSNADRKYACMYDFQTGNQYAGGAYEGKKYTASCQSIYNAYSSMPTGYYTIVTAYSETNYQDGQATPCVFASGKSANNPVEVINQCKDSTTSNHAACARAYLDNLNGSCEEIKAAGVTTSAFYKITTMAAKGSSNYTVTNEEKACHFVGGSLASASQSVSDCNTYRAGSVACGYAWQNSWNRTCDDIRNISISFINQTNVLMNGLKSSSGTSTCCYSNGTVVSDSNYCCSKRRDYNNNACVASCSYGTTSDYRCCPSNLRQAYGNSCYECGNNYSCSGGEVCNSSYGGSCYQPCECSGTGKICRSGDVYKCDGCNYSRYSSCSCGCSGGSCVSGCSGSPTCSGDRVKYCNGCSYSYRSCAYGCSGGSCNECTSDSHCGSGYKCSSGSCVRCECSGTSSTCSGSQVKRCDGCKYVYTACANGCSNGSCCSCSGSSATCSGKRVKRCDGCNYTYSSCSGACYNGSCVACNSNSDCPGSKCGPLNAWVKDVCNNHKCCAWILGSPQCC